MSHVFCMLCTLSLLTESRSGTLMMSWPGGTGHVIAHLHEWSARGALRRLQVQDADTEHLAHQIDDLQVRWEETSTALREAESSLDCVSKERDQLQCKLVIKDQCVLRFWYCGICR